MPSEESGVQCGRRNAESGVSDRGLVRTDNENKILVDFGRAVSKLEGSRGKNQS